MSTAKRALLLTIFFILVSPTQSLFSVSDIEPPSKTTLTKRQKKKAAKVEGKIERKIDKLKKRLAELKEIDEEDKSGKGLIIAGGILLLLGLILILAGASTSNRNDPTIDDAVFGCLGILGGLVLGIVGLVLLIVGLAI